MALTKSQCASIAEHNAAAATSSVARYQWTAWEVTNRMNLDDELTLALMEAPWAETHWTNYANDGHRGPEDQTGTKSTDAQLEAAAESLALPHDAVGSDHASVGILQQQVGPGFSWGSVSEAMDPQHALEAFAQRALGSKARGKGAALVAQSVQHSKFRDGRNYAHYEPEAQALINRMKLSCIPRDPLAASR